MQKIVPFLWFDTQAEEAASFYVSLFPNGKIIHVERYGKSGAAVAGRPEGSAMTVSFELARYQMTALNGGPIFNITPAISFFVSCDTEDEVDQLWAALAAGGKVLMELNDYPFSKKFGWVQDRYGVSWQVNLASHPQKIRPCLMYTGAQNGKAEAAMKLYTSLFENSEIVAIHRYTTTEADTAGNIKHAVFSLAGQGFIAMDSGFAHAFNFTEAVSLQINCQSQEEVDQLWTALSADPKAEQCGWVKDQFGVSWQIVPVALMQLLSGSDAQKNERVMAAMLKMKKINIAELQAAADAV